MERVPEFLFTQEQDFKLALLIQFDECQDEDGHGF